MRGSAVRNQCSGGRRCGLLVSPGPIGPLRGVGPRVEAECVLFREESVRRSGETAIV